MALVGPSITDDASVDAADSSVLEQGLPTPEQGVRLHGDGIRDADGRVAPADDVHVPMQGAVLHGAGVADARLEPEIRSEGVQRRPRGDELEVGRRHHPAAGLPARQHMPGGVLHHHPHDRPLERLLGDGLVHFLLQRLRLQSEAHRQRPDKHHLPHTAKIGFFRIFAICYSERYELQTG